MKMEILNEVMANQTYLIEECFEYGVFDYEEVQNVTSETEIFSWFLVSEFLANALIEMGEPVLSNELGNWWGRTCYGIPLEDDPVLKKINAKLLN